MILSSSHSSLKGYLLSCASRFGRPFNKNKVEEWTHDYSQTMDRRYMVETACRRARELAESGALEVEFRGTKPKVAWYRINKRIYK